MSRATVEDSTAGLGQPLRSGRPLVGGFSFHGVSGPCMSSGHENAAGSGLGLLLWGVRQLLAIHTSLMATVVSSVAPNLSAAQQPLALLPTLRWWECKRAPDVMEWKIETGGAEVSA